MKATRCYQDPLRSSAHIWEGSSSRCEATESTSPQLCCHPHACGAAAGGSPGRSQAPRGRKDSSGARTAPVCSQPPKITGSTPGPAHGTDGVGRETRVLPSHVHPSQRTFLIVKGRGRDCPCSPIPVVLGILREKDAPALSASTWLKDRRSRHLSSGEETKRLGLCTQPWPTARTVRGDSAAPTPHPSGTGPR